MPENTSTSTVVLVVNVNEALILRHSVAYRLSGPNAARFKINATTGQMTFVASPNYEAPADQGVDNGYQVTVTATANAVPSRFVRSNEIAQGLAV